MARVRKLIDPSGDPLVEVWFAWTDTDLAVLIRAQQGTDLWAAQELSENAPGDWRTHGPVKWHRADLTRCDVTARVARRPGLDQQLRRIGPTVERYRAFVGELPPDSDAATIGRELLSRLKAVGFAARTHRGRTSEPVEGHTFVGSGHQAKQRQRRREGLVKPQLSADELAFYRLTGL